MILLKLSLCILILSGCNNLNKITILGKAENVKGGAVVTSNNDRKMYHLDKLDFWPNEIIGKTVKVSGRLKIKEYKPIPPDEDIPQQITGVKLILLKPKWEFIE